MSESSQGAAAAVTNRLNFVTHNITAPIGGVELTGGTSLPVPNGFAVTVKSNTDNPGAARIYVADSGANTTVAGNRFTLGPGEGISIYVTDAILIFVGSNSGTASVDWVVEQ